MYKTDSDIRQAVLAHILQYTTILITNMFRVCYEQFIFCFINHSLKVKWNNKKQNINMQV